MYGNTYQSPYYEIKLEGDNEIKLLDPKPFNAYVLSPDPDNDSMLIQFVIIETDINDKDCIKSQTCERWALIPFTKLKEKTNAREINIVKGSPRYLLYNDYETIKKFEGYLICTLTEYPQLQDIDFLLPDYIILSEGEILPGLANSFITQEPDFETLTQFETIYIKNIMIQISPGLERRIIEFE